MPDPSLLLDEPEERTGPDPTLLDFGSSQRLPSSYDRARRASTEPSGLLPDLDLGLDLGDDMFSRQSRERSIEVGRREARPERTLEEEMDETTGLYDGPDLGIDIGESGLAQRGQGRLSSIAPNLDDDMAMGGMMEDDMRMPTEADIQATSAPLARRQQRQTLSPLSSIRSSVERDLEKTFHNREPTMIEEDEETIHHAQRAKRRKVLPADTETEMRSAEIRALQNDRSKILKPAQFLPRDPVLLALMQMQREGNFVSSILGDASRQRGMAPELRGVLSLEVVRQSAERKRKREAGLLPTPPPEEGEEEEEEPQIRIPAEDEDILNQPGAGFEFGGDTTLGADEARPTIEDDEGMQPGMDDEAPARAGSEAAPRVDDDEPIQHNSPHEFDETIAPILHPAESGPVSLGTKHAVHMLRERFAPDAASTSTPSKRTKASVLFQDMLPEATTTRADATKMFFEVLVLATKDAVKVEQEGEEIGGPLRIRGKRGLWGSWADEGVVGGAQEGVEGEAVAAA